MRDFIYALLRTQTAYRQVFQREMRKEKISISFEMLQIMSCLFNEELMNQQDIANKTFRDKSSLSYILKNLEKKGLIERVEDTKDKRNKLIHLTPKGVDMEAKIQNVVKGVYNNILKTKGINKKVSLCKEYLEDIELAFKNKLNEV